MIRWILNGDRDAAAKYRGEGTRLLAQSNNVMEYLGINQYQMDRVFPDGTTINVKNSFGNEIVTITSPFAPPKEVELVEGFKLELVMFLADHPYLIGFYVTSKGYGIEFDPVDFQSGYITWAWSNASAASGPARGSCCVTSDADKLNHHIRSVGEDILGGYTTLHPSRLWLPPAPAYDGVYSYIGGINQNFGVYVSTKICSTGKDETPSVPQSQGLRYGTLIYREPSIGSPLKTIPTGCYGGGPRPYTLEILDDGSYGLPVSWEEYIYLPDPTNKYEYSLRYKTATGEQELTNIYAGHWYPEVHIVNYVSGWKWSCTPGLFDCPYSHETSFHSAATLYPIGSIGGLKTCFIVEHGSKQFNYLWHGYGCCENPIDDTLTTTLQTLYFGDDAIYTGTYYYRVYGSGIFNQDSYGKCVAMNAYDSINGDEEYVCVYDVTDYLSTAPTVNTSGSISTWLVYKTNGFKNKLFLNSHTYEYDWGGTGPYWSTISIGGYRLWGTSVQITDKYIIYSYTLQDAVIPEQQFQKVSGWNTVKRVVGVIDKKTGSLFTKDFYPLGSAPPSSLSVIDVEGGNLEGDYSFTVCAINPCSRTSYSSNVNISISSSPDVTKRGVRLAWTPVSGATHYAVTVSTVVLVVTSKTEFVWKGESISQWGSYSSARKGYQEFPVFAVGETSVPVEDLIFPNGR